MHNKRLLLLLLVGLAAGAQWFEVGGTRNVEPAAASDSVLARAFADRRSDVQVRGSGRVVKMLADDLRGRRHQRFIVELDNRQTLLIAHNIDLADRIDSLNIGDRVEFYGEYEWNNKGGVLHWTHRDPNNRHAHGWLQHQGRTYQ